MRLTPLSVPLLASVVLAAGCGGTDEVALPGPAVKSAVKTTAAPSGTIVRERSITQQMTEFAFAPRDLRVAAGRFTITARNTGKIVHELILIRTDRAPGSFAVANGRVSETGSVGEISETKPGASGTHTFQLKPGRYVLVCNIAGHYQAGMYGSLVAG
jgi:uncharacterized cupredoxin-like copper-binding protein